MDFLQRDAIEQTDGIPRTVTHVRRSIMVRLREKHDNNNEEETRPSLLSTLFIGQYVYEFPSIMAYCSPLNIDEGELG